MLLKQSFYILGIVILFSLIALSSNAGSDTSKVLPKTLDMASANKKSSSSGSSNDSMVVKDDSDDNENKEEDLAAEPDQNFKLIAVYLVGNKPRALIKNLDKPEDPVKEYKIGDYLDELQFFSVSKILFNPTVRIELIDLNGLSYILKPKSTDSANNPSSSRSLPTYSSGGHKSKIKRAIPTTVKPVEKKKEESQSLESAIKNDTANTTTQTTTAPPVSAPPDATQTPPPAVALPSPEQTQSTTTPTSAPSVEQIQNTPTQQDIGSTSGQSAPPASTSVGKTDSSMTGSSGSDSTDIISRPSNPFGE